MKVGLTDTGGGWAEPHLARSVPDQAREAGTEAGDRNKEAVAAGHDHPDRTVGMVERQLEGTSLSFRYSFYGTHGEKVAVKVVDQQTGAVVREIPSREMQALQRKVKELVGTIFDRNA